MLRIRKLTLNNFGAYYGSHSIEINQNDGVVLVWGENGFGKTTIMNAFRFVLWNQILSRTGRLVSPHKYVNLRCIPEMGNMSVELIINYNEATYTITRSYERKSGKGDNDIDYLKSFNILENGQALSQDNAVKTLNALLPIEISRFYLFDAELMAEYEKLLDPENTDGEKIKSAIEDLLGMPILLNGRTIVQEEAESYRRSATKIAGQDNKCKALAQQNETNRIILSQLREANSKLTKEREDLLMKQNEIKSQMISNKRLLEYLTNKERLEATLEEQKNIIEEDINNLKTEADISWKSVLYTIAEEIRRKNLEKIDELTGSASFDNFAESVLYMLKAKKEDYTCPTCNTHLSPDTYNKLIDSFENSLNRSSQASAEIGLLKSANNKLSSFEKVDNKSLIDNIASNLNIHKANSIVTKSKIDDVLAQIQQEGNNDNLETDIIELPSKLSEVESQLMLNQQALDKNIEDIEKLTKSIEQLDQMIESQAGGHDFEIANEKAKTVEQLKLLFDESISKFRSELITNVETDASSFFVNITNNPTQYDHLEINDNFGLEIIHKDGIIVPNRSAGEEQIVAFSLVSALHKNAPVDGPIFMDSTFQKIDGGHQAKSAKSLLSFNTQVIILAYKDEIKDVNAIYNCIGNKLLREYEIIKVNGDTFKAALIDHVRS